MLHMQWGAASSVLNMITSETLRLNSCHKYVMVLRQSHHGNHSPTNQHLQRSANISNEARLDVRARVFWRRGQNAFFDIGVTKASAASQINSSLNSILKKYEAETRDNITSAS